MYFYLPKSGFAGRVSGDHEKIREILVLNHLIIFPSLVQLAPSAPILLSEMPPFISLCSASRYGLQRVAQRLPSDELALALAAPDRWDAFTAKFGPLEALAMCLMQCCNGGALAQDGTAVAARARFFQACVVRMRAINLKQ